MAVNDHNRMLAEFFYLDAEGMAQGPYSPAQLLSLETLGYIHPDTLVAAAGSADWQPFSTLTAKLGEELGAWYRERLNLPLPGSPTPPAPSEPAASTGPSATPGKRKGKGPLDPQATGPSDSLATPEPTPAELAALAAAAVQGSRSRLMPALLIFQSILILVLLAFLVPLISRVTQFGGSLDRLSESLPGETARASASATRQVFGEFENSLMAKLAHGTGPGQVPSPTGKDAKKSEVPAFLLKRTTAREVKLEDFLAALDVESEGALRNSQPAAWRELELLTSSNVFRGLTQKARESFLAERVAVFREWPDLRFEHSPLTEELVKFLRTLSEKETQQLCTPAGLKTVVHRLAAQTKSVRIVREFTDDPLKLPDWEGINNASRDRAWKIYPASRDLGSPLMARIDEIHRRIEHEKHPLMANPFYPWIVTEMAADSMGIRPVDPYPAPPSAELQAAEKELKYMGDPAEIAKEMTAFPLHPEGDEPSPGPSPPPAVAPELPASAPDTPTVAPAAPPTETAAAAPSVPAPDVAPTNPMIDFAPATPEIKAVGTNGAVKTDDAATPAAEPAEPPPANEDKVTSTTP